MKTFYLKSRDGEVINKVDAESKEDAIKLLSEIKGLPVKAMLQIYKVD